MKNNIKNGWNVMKEIAGKSKFKSKKLLPRIVKNTHFEQYVKYESPNLERRELCDEETNISYLKSNKNPGYDDISSNVLKKVLEEIFGV